MKRLPQSQVSLDEPDQALLGYLQTLLDEIPDEPEVAVAQAAPSPKPVAPAPPVQETRVETVQPTPKVAPEPPVPEVDSAVKQSVEPEVQVEPALPDWTRESFQALSFEAAGAQFGLRLLDMKSIVPMEAPLTHLPGRPHWHLGVLLVRGDKVGVVDLARLLHGPGAAATAVDDAYVLLLNGSRWGLACKKLGSAFRVEPDDVRWRRNSAGPRYIRGVLRNSMTPLLDAVEILQKLDGMPNRG